LNDRLILSLQFIAQPGILSEQETPELILGLHVGHKLWDTQCQYIFLKEGIQTEVSNKGL